MLKLCISGVGFFFEVFGRIPMLTAKVHVEQTKHPDIVDFFQPCDHVMSTCFSIPCRKITITTEQELNNYRP